MNEPELTTPDTTAGLSQAASLKVFQLTLRLRNKETKQVLIDRTPGMGDDLFKSLCAATASGYDATIIDVALVST